MDDVVPPKYPDVVVTVPTSVKVLELIDNVPLVNDKIPLTVNDDDAAIVAPFASFSCKLEYGRVRLWYERLNRLTVN